MDISNIAAQQLLQSTGQNPASDQGFRMIFQEQLAQPQSNAAASPATLMRAIGQNFMENESRLQVEKLNFMNAYIGPLANSGVVASGGIPVQAGLNSNIQGGVTGTGQAGEVMRASAPSSGSRFSSNGWTINGTSPASQNVGAFGNQSGTRAVFAESRPDTPTPMQSALGLSSDGNINTFDFAGNIQNLTSRINGLTNDIKQTINKQPQGIEEVTKHNAKVQGMIREADDLNSYRSMLSSLHISSYQESRTRMLTVYEHLTGAFKKLNEIVNSLKQSS